MRKYVLDSSAVLGLIFDEDAASEVAARLHDASISAVTLSEAVSHLTAMDMPEDMVRTVVDTLQFDVVSYDLDQAIVAGLMVDPSENDQLSAGARACAALATARNAIVLTTSKAWESAKALDGLRVEIVG